MGQIFNISASLPFLDSLAEGIKRRFEPGRTTVLLPTKRAIGQLRFMFPSPPHIQALGDLDEVQPISAIPKVSRIMEIAKIIRQKSENLDIAQSTRLAKSLAELIDEMQAKNLPLTALKNIVPLEFSEHWQKTYSFLNDILPEWQNFLRERSLLEPIQARNAEFIEQIRQLRENPPGRPYIIAGSTGTVQMTLELIKTVYNSKNGIIILHGLDKNLTDEDFKNLEEAHPQFLLSRMLDFLNVPPSSVDEWQEAAQTPRQNLISNSLFPAARTSEWKNFRPDPKGLTLIECKNSEEESAAICQLLQKAMAEKKSAMVVTNNNELKKRIKAKMKIWDIEINDSAGHSMLSKPPVNFLMRLALLGTEKKSPVKILSAFKHNIVPAEIKTKIREIEILHLRGVRNDDFDITSHLQINGLGTFLNIFEVIKVLLSDLLSAHLTLAKSIAGENSFDEISELLSELQKIASGFGQIDPLSYPELLKSIFSSKVWWPDYKPDSKINIFSPIEARMQTADICVLAGMNESNMPSLPEPDLFLNQQMRRTLGLDLPSVKIGQQAHDFELLSQVNQVFYTRSLKENNSPSTPSRFIESLTTIVKLPDGNEYKLAAKKLITPEKIIPCNRPQPKPPVAARPKKLSATKIGKLMRDPYSIYASEILKLKKLEEIDAEITAREFGNFIHAVLHKFNGIYDGKFETLIECGKKALAELGNIKEFQKFWWPRFERISAQLIKLEHERRAGGAEIKSEISGSYNFGEFEIYARADRLEISPQGINVVDYKTGIIPSQKDLNLGIEPQLALEGLIFEEKFKKPVAAFEYWAVKGRMNDELSVEKRTADLENIKTKVKSLLDEFLNKETAFAAKPRPHYALEYNDYEHLARNKEWEQ